MSNRRISTVLVDVFIYCPRRDSLLTYGTLDFGKGIVGVHDKLKVGAVP
jgi:hypothetical protein